MANWQEKIISWRELSEPEKKKLVFTLASVITAIIFFLWLINVLVILSNGDSLETKPPEQNIEVNTPVRESSTWVKFKAGVGYFGESVAEGWRVWRGK